jgi:hypothetical protein
MRFGICAHQFGASSCHKGATAAEIDDRAQLVMAGGTATGILAFFSVSRGPASTFGRCGGRPTAAVPTGAEATREAATEAFARSW